MDCKRAEEILRASIDGELPTALGGQLDRHLQACPECSALMVEARRISKAIRLGTPPLQGLPRSLDPESILARARALELEEDYSLLNALKRVAAAAAVFIVASGILIFWTSANDHPVRAASTSLSTIAVSAENASFKGLIDDETWILMDLLRG